MERLLLLPIMAICITRTIGYGIYSVREKNRAGAFGVFLLASAATVASVYFIMK